MKLLIATHNPAKIVEFKTFLQILNSKGIQILTLKDLNIIEEPEETGETLAANAELKARFYAEKAGFAVLADDGGFEIATLNGEPGVKSNRWLGRKASDRELIDYTLERMKNIPEEKRQACLRLCLCYFNPVNNLMEKVEAKIEGFVAQIPSQQKLEGFPFRAVHIVSPFNKYYDELTLEEHAEANHRQKAVLEILPKILADLLEK